MSQRKTSFFVVLLVVSTLTGCRAKSSSPAETAAVYWVKHHITVGGKNDVNPYKATADNIAEGKDAFTSYCMVCHGMDGQNTGVPFADTVSPQVPSLASLRVQQYTDGQLKWIIKNGLWPSGMPPSNGEFSNREMWEMVLYIRHLPPAGSLGSPAVYGGSTSK
jgi:mono/diheme cytochrome c family protein